MDEMFAIKCQNCGGPMYSHQAKRSFECAYCGTVIPWEADADETCGKARVGAAGGVDRLALAARNKRMYQLIYK